MDLKHNIAFRAAVLGLSLLAPLPSLGGQAMVPSDDIKSVILAGNAMVKPETLERLIRTAIADALKGSVKGSSLQFKTPSVSESLSVKSPVGDFQEILNILNVTHDLPVKMSGVQAQLTLPASDLDLVVAPLPHNQFSVKAQWKISQFDGQSKNLNLIIPKGFFPQPCSISSQGLKMGLVPHSAPITAELNLVADLTANGILLHLKDLKTNIDAKKDAPEVYATLGPLTACGKPLTIDIDFPNGKKLHADEQSIRAEFQQIEPTLIAGIRSKLSDIIESNFNRIAKKLVTSPLKVTLQSDTLLSDVTKDPAVKKVFSGVSLNFFPSYLQYANNAKLFGAQFGSTLCFGAKCIPNSLAASPIDTTDFKPLAKSDSGGIILDESWVQSLVHSQEFQSRIQAYYKSTGGSAGVTIGPSGVRVHLDPARNAIVVVANLVIDIKKTDADGWLNREENNLGSLIEKTFGSGKAVVIPIEVAFRIAGLQSIGSNKMEVVLNSEMPFLPNSAGVRNTYHYPSNVDEMIVSPVNIKKSFLKSLQTKITALVPHTITIPMNKTIAIENFHVQPTGVTITPHHGLLITAVLK